MVFFGISLPQASLDVAAYIELAPTNISYNRKEKAYFAASGFSPKLILADSAMYLQELLNQSDASFVGWAPPFCAVPHPSRQVEASVLRQVLFAIREHRMLNVEYQSMSRPSPTVRTISPHAVGYDGFRWHARAYCHEHGEFRDFVFARMLKVRGSKPSAIDSDTDEAWERKLDLILAPHPNLSEAQSRAVAMDYAMKGGQVVLKTRQALAFYVLRQLGLDKQTGEAPGQQIVLLNREQIEPFLQNHD